MQDEAGEVFLAAGADLTEHLLLHRLLAVAQQCWFVSFKTVLLPLPKAGFQGSADAYHGICVREFERQALFARPGLSAQESQDWALLSPWYTACCTAVEGPSCFVRFLAALFMCR
eukprot:s1230_g18.t1